MDLVVSASTGVMKTLLPKLAEMLKDEHNLHRGVKEGIKYLQEELESMQAALEKVSAVPADQLDPQVKLWARKVREMSYDIADIIDSYMVRVESDQPSCDINRLIGKIKGLLPMRGARRNIAVEVERIKKDVKEVAERRERHKLDDIVVGAPAQPIDPRLPALYEDASNLVGIDRSREDLIKLLSVEGGGGVLEQKLTVVSIVGPGGIGKTTLANLVYRKLQGQFDCGAFVSVSLNPNMKNILGSILRQVSKQKYENNEAWDVKEFIDNIRDVLQDKRYFIIIDDIWDESVWRLLRCVLIENNCGSKIITTTRNMGVAKSCCSSDNVPAIIHELPPLSIDESKKLFYYKLFREDKCPPEFKDVSEKVLKRCDGLPLAILTTASLFTSKKTKDQWYDVYNSIHTELENNQDVKDMWAILSLSYCDLPSQLKTCLLYLSLFPEDHNIERDDLIRRWVAEGFVHAKEDKNVYEVGENYFNKLIYRNMIQPAYVDAHGRVQACRVHDIVLKFITSLSTEENFVTILNSQHHLNLSNKIRRLSLQDNKDERTVPQATTNLSHVRSLTVFWHAIDFKLPLSSFQVLRVLDLEDCSSHNIKDIGNLVHLRYLRLSGTHCVELPKNIGNLQFLETLDIKRTRIKVLPSTVVQLRQLLRLYVDTLTKLPHGIRSMKSLDELSEIDISIYPNLTEMLGNLSKLRVLEISLGSGTWVKRYEEPFVKCLRNLKKLQTLNIIVGQSEVSLDFMLELAWAPQHLRRFMACVSRRTEHLFSLSPSSAFSPFSTLPTWIDSSLSNLAELFIMVKILRQKDLEILGGLPALSCLDLHVAESTKESRFEITADHAITFRCLATFRFASHAVRLVFRRGAMRSLWMLSLSFHLRRTKEIHGDCDMDMGLENLVSLKAVEVGIDCYCAKLWEVQAAEAAVRNSTNLNPNHPTLDFSRHFERQMLWDGMEISEPEATKELAGLAKIGPWGGNGGMPHDIRVAPHRLESIAIRSGVVVDSLSFTYRDRDGQQHTAGPWGGYDGSGHTIQLRPSEFLTEISGTIGPFHRMHSIITSLTFVTNADSYGPFGGGGGGTSFHLPVQCNGSIVGFFARAGWYIDAIGVYANPKLDEEEEAGLAKIGPWGGNGGMPCDTEVAPHCLQSVTICSGGIVDSIAFSYSDRNGQQHTVGPWGGHGGSKYKFQLCPSEFLTGVSGTTGPFGALPNVITSLMFVTNARSYGPFGGGGGGTPFHTPLRSNCSIVGFFGRASIYVDAIGVYANPELEILKEEDAGISKIGPWGGHGGMTHDINVAPHRLESVTICSCIVVDSLAFSYSDNNGQQHSAGPWGGHGGINYTIQLGPSEFLTKVSGTIGPFGAFSSVITSLTIVTNAGAHGPFGQGGGIPFHAPMQSNDSIVGFFVRAGLYVDAIGFYARPL